MTATPARTALSGQETKIDYGYRVHGEEFMMDTRDYLSKKDVLVLVEEAPKPVSKASKSQAELEEAAPEKTEAKDGDSQPLDLIEGLTVSALDSLRKNGIKTVGDARFAGRDALLAMDKVGTRTVDLILGAE